MRHENQEELIRVAITGAAGRMGTALVRALRDHPALKLTHAFERPGSAVLGTDAGVLAGGPGMGIPVTEFDPALPATDVVIDFSRPDPTVAHARACAATGTRLVIGTTGLAAGQQHEIERASRECAIVQAPNMSPGVNLCFHLAAIAARTLGPQVDVEIIEAHHRAKVDAPSGTALRFGEVVAAARGTTLASQAAFARHGAAGPRPDGEIGFAVIRGGDIVGDHTVLFAATGERVEITHRASSRENFAEGALRAASWLMGHRQGLFDMQDVLGLRV